MIWAYIVALIPGIIGAALSAVMFTGEVGLGAAPRAARFAAIGFVLGYGLSAWGLIQWWG